MIFLHHGKRVGHSGAAAYCHGIIYHTILGTLHSVYLTGLFGYRHILVYHTYTTFARYGYGQSSLGDCVHGRGDKGHIQRDVA